MASNDADCHFVAEFSDGYSIRNLTNYLRHTRIDGNLIFTKDAIRYHELTPDNIILTDVNIPVSRINRYVFNAKDDDMVIVGVAMSELQAGAKFVNKKDGLRIYLKKDDPYLYMQAMSSKKTQRPNIHVIKTKSLPYEIYEIPKYERLDTDPNCNSDLSEFTRICKNLSSIKCDYISILGYPKGVKMAAYSEGRIIGHAENFGDVPAQSQGLSDYQDVFNIDLTTKASIGPTTGKKPILNVRPSGNVASILVDNDNIKILSHLNNVCINGILTFHLEKGNPLKLSIPIGYMGYVDIYIRDRKEANQ